MTDMDDVLPVPETLELPVAPAAEQDKDAMAVDDAQLPNEESQAMQMDETPVARVPGTTVEVVIEMKAVLPPEDPILPDHYYDNGRIPVFKPVGRLLTRVLRANVLQTMDQFRDFERFITRVNDYGMQSGIIKVIPPPEWYS
jgi:hypothetical protein